MISYLSRENCACSAYICIDMNVGVIVRTVVVLIDICNVPNSCDSIVFSIICLNFQEKIHCQLQLLYLMYKEFISNVYEYTVIIAEQSKGLSYTI